MARERRIRDEDPDPGPGKGGDHGGNAADQQTQNDVDNQSSDGIHLPGEASASRWKVFLLGVRSFFRP